MQFKQLFFLLSFFLSFCFIIQAETIKISKPQRTELVSEDTRNKDKNGVSLFIYNSELSQESIINFYRDIFFKQKLKEERPKDRGEFKGEIILFTKDNLLRAQLFFLSAYQGKSNYGLIVYDFDEELIEKLKQETGKSGCPTCAKSKIK